MAKDTTKPEKYDEDKRREILLPVCICGKTIEGKMGPDRIELESLLAGAGLETRTAVSLKQEIPQTFVDDCTLAEGS